MTSNPERDVFTATILANATLYIRALLHALDVWAVNPCGFDSVVNIEQEAEK